MTVTWSNLVFRGETVWSVAAPCKDANQVLLCVLALAGGVNRCRARTEFFELIFFCEFFSTWIRV